MVRPPSTDGAWPVAKELRFTIEAPPIEPSAPLTSATLASNLRIGVTPGDASDDAPVVAQCRAMPPVMSNSAPVA